jgi:hypothetical protein
MISPEMIQSATAQPQPTGLAQSTIDSWQQAHGLALPDALVGLYKQSNGGPLMWMQEQYHLLSLQDVTVLNDDRARGMLRLSTAEVTQALTDASVPLPWWLIPFAFGPSGQIYMLHYTEAGMHVLPALIEMHGNHVSYRDLDAANWLRHFAQTTDAPTVSLEHAVHYDLIADQQVLLPDSNGSHTLRRQLLCRSDTELLLFTREVNVKGDNQGEERRQLIRIGRHLQIRDLFVHSTETRPGYPPIHGLHLPCNSDQLGSIAESVRLHDSQWQSRSRSSRDGLWLLSHDGNLLQNLCTALVPVRPASASEAAHIATEPVLVEEDDWIEIDQGLLSRPVEPTALPYIPALASRVIPAATPGRGQPSQSWKPLNRKATTLPLPRPKPALSL